MLALCLLAVGTGACAEQPIAAEPAPAEPMVAQSISAQPLAISESQALSSIQWLASLAARKMPRSYDGDKNWGDTKKVWAGVKFRRDGWKLKTHRRFRELRHGRWVKYEVQAIGEPQVDVNSVVRATEDRWRIDSAISMPMKFNARIERWNLGVQLYSLSVAGELRVRLSAATTIGAGVDYTEVPPALMIDPIVEHAQLKLQGFEVDRVSKVGGDVAEQWGEIIQELIIERLVDKQNDRIVKKLNASIDKNRDDLRLSMSDWFAKW